MNLQWIDSCISPFASAAPTVRLIDATDRPYEQAVAAARTCYASQGVVTADQVSGQGLATQKQTDRIQLRDKIAQSTFKAGHHTTLQHGQVSFALDGVSRQFVWSFLHNHPFYNSEQVSQRYVEVRSDRVAVPQLPATAMAVYQRCVTEQMADYQALIELLTPVAAAEYAALFTARAKRPQRWQATIHKRAQEVARYVLPVATQTWMVHTVSVLTLLRYIRLCECGDTSAEARYVIGEMARQLYAVDPLLAQLPVEPLPEEGPEAHNSAPHLDFVASRAMASEFDEALGGKTAVLLDRFVSNPRRVADAVRQVLGQPRGALSDEAAIGLALDPAKNHLLGGTLNTTAHHALGRTLHAAHYVFAKSLSHAADSQDQRHRLTPASRPTLPAYLHDQPDYVVPRLVAHAGGQVERRYRTSMTRTWSAIATLRNLGVSPQWQAYLLPNSVRLRFTESCDLAALRHKHAMRLCYNAQEEIWQASMDEAGAIAAVEPEIGQYLLPPCAIRHAAGLRPYCPEGDRYCGVPVWTLPRSAWQRLL